MNMLLTFHVFVACTTKNFYCDIILFTKELCMFTTICVAKLTVIYTLLGCRLIDVRYTLVLASVNGQFSFIFESLSMNT